MALVFTGILNNPKEGNAWIYLLQHVEYNTSWRDHVALWLHQIDVEQGSRREIIQLDLMSQDKIYVGWRCIPCVMDKVSLSESYSVDLQL
jgi:hypothetical protein